MYGMDIYCTNFNLFPKVILDWIQYTGCSKHIVIFGLLTVRYFNCKGRVKKKVIFVTLGSDSPPPKSDNNFFGN